MLFRDEMLRAKEWRTAVPLKWRCAHENWIKWTTRTRSAISKIPVFEISNVADYFYLSTDQEYWDLFTDFPRPMPPFEDMWLEFVLPSQTFSEGSVNPLPAREAFKRVGCHLSCIDTERFSPADRKMKETSGMNPEVRYILNAGIYLEGHDKLVANICYVAFGMTVAGDPIPFTAEGQKLSYVFPGADGVLTGDKECAEVMTELGEQSCSFLYVAMLAMSLVNCRNVSTRTVRSPEKLIAKHARNGVALTAAHHVIEIQPMIRSVQAVTAESGYSRRAAAVVRGHFKDYSEGKGLFGQHKGMFWWHQRSGGIAAKVEYRLKHAVGGLDSKWATPEKA